MVTITLLTQILVVGDHKFSRAQYCVVKLLLISPPQQTCTKTNLYFLVDPFYSSVKPLRWLPLHMSHWILTTIITRPHFSFLFVIYCLFPLIYNPTHLLPPNLHPSFDLLCHKSLLRCNQCNNAWGELDIGEDKVLSALVWKIWLCLRVSAPTNNWLSYQWGPPLLLVLNIWLLPCHKLSNRT